MHQHSFFHRDIKTQNIIFGADGTAKVADFGLARVISNKEMMKTACGTPGYVAPEVLRGEGATTSPKGKTHHHSRGPKLVGIATADEPPLAEGTETAGVGAGSGSIEPTSPPRLVNLNPVNVTSDPKARLGDWAQALGKVSEGMSSPKAVASVRVSENFTPAEDPAPAYPPTSSRNVEQEAGANSSVY